MPELSRVARLSFAGTWRASKGTTGVAMLNRDGPRPHDNTSPKRPAAAKTHRGIVFDKIARTILQSRIQPGHYLLSLRKSAPNSPAQSALVLV
jgi:hypothetical protein